MTKTQSIKQTIANKSPELQPEVDQKEKPAPRVKARQFRKTAKNEIEKNYQKIVEKLSEKASDGSIQHTKLLFGLGGIEEKAEKTAPRRRRGPSLGKLLLEGAERARREALQTADNANVDLNDQKANQ